MSAEFFGVCRCLEQAARRLSALLSDPGLTLLMATRGFFTLWCFYSKYSQHFSMVHCTYTHIHTHIFISVLDMIGTSDWPRLAKACKISLFTHLWSCHTAASQQQLAFGCIAPECIIAAAVHDDDAVRC